MTSHDTPGNITLQEAVFNKIRERLYTPSKLLYLDYHDYLDSDVVRTLVDGDYDAAVDAIYDRLFENHHDAACYWVNEAIEDANLTDEETETLDTSEWVRQELIDTVVENDTQDLIADLARNTPDVTVMVPLIGEDDAEWGEDRKASQLCEALGATDEYHYRTAKELISEAPTDLGMAWVVFDANVLDIYNGALDEGVVKIANPCVVYGNPFTGGVWAENFQGLEFTANVKDVMNDGAWGYPCEEAWGCNPSEGERVDFAKHGEPTVPLKNGSLAHLDILRDYCDRWG